MEIWHLKQKIKAVFEDKKLSPSTLIINCNPRSGSTWLLDCLRCHPKISYTRNYVFFNALKIIGRRYPQDLSTLNSSGKEIETLPRKFEKIPEFRIEPKPYHEGIANFSIEKIHPEFYLFQTQKFIKRIIKFEKKGYQFKWILLARHPSGTFNSYLKYIKRNPTWHGKNFNQSELLEHYRLTYQSLLDFKENCGGLCLNYDDFQKHPATFLSKIYDYLWGENIYPSLAAKAADIQASLDLTSREKRQASGTSFLGKKAGKATVDSNSFKLKLRDESDRDKYDLCVDIFEKIIAPTS